MDRDEVVGVCERLFHFCANNSSTLETREKWRTKVNELRALALRGLEAQWQPIETAPKDGSCFLACSGSWQTVCHWHRAAESWATNGPLYSLYPPDEPPTHWMPLPPAHGAKEPT